MISLVSPKTLETAYDGVEEDTARHHENTLRELYLPTLSFSVRPLWFNYTVCSSLFPMFKALFSHLNDSILCKSLCPRVCLPASFTSPSRIRCISVFLGHCINAMVTLSHISKLSIRPDHHIIHNGDNATVKESYFVLALITTMIQQQVCPVVGIITALVYIPNILLAYRTQN